VEIASGLHRIEAPLGNRYVALYLVVGDTASLLVDTGVADSFDTALLPYLDRTGVAVDSIRYAVNTHADFDHVGGNRAVRTHFPNALLMCGESDRAMICDIDLMIRQRYGEFRDYHGFDETDDTKAFIRSTAASSPVDVGLSGGEAIDLGGRTVDVLHTPGHTWGHLSLYDRVTGSLMIGDAVLGESVLTAEGEPAFPPTYRYVDSYRATIRRMRSMHVDWLLTAHYPVYQGAAAGGFLDTSLAYTDRVEQVITQILSEADAPLTLLDLVAASRKLLGSWDEDSSVLLVYPILGHLEVLVQRGVVDQGRDEQTGRATFAT
jgi:glyoxylase-like metal-dependent hydrolase (beta-lactamase superfamily II)